MSKELLVVFDIDETLIHFVSHKYTHLFLELDEKIQDEFNYIRDGDNIVIFRPYLRELFNYYLEHPHIRVALWTYSEQEYAYSIKQILTDVLGLPEDFFLFVYGAEDMINEETGEEDDYPKNLQKVYSNFPQFNVFNTFIVDDAPGNIRHEVNKENCILIQPFAPFGAEKVREDIGESGIEIALNDKKLEQVEIISNKVMEDIDGCSPEDIEGAFDTEPVFSKPRVRRMDLGKYMKTFAKIVNRVDLLTIGRPKLSKNLIELPDSMVLEGGGKRKTTKKKKRKKTRQKKRKKTRQKKRK